MEEHGDYNVRLSTKVDAVLTDSVDNSEDGAGRPMNIHCDRDHLSLSLTSKEKNYRSLRSSNRRGTPPSLEAPRSRRVPSKNQL